MANTNKPFGLRLVSDTKVGLYYTNDGTVFYVNDPVKLTGTSGAVSAGDMYRPAVQKATSGNVVVGVCIGFIPTYLTPELRYHTASTAQYVFVAEALETAVFEIQGDSTTFAVTDIGLNAGWNASSGSTSTGISNATLAGSGKNTTSSLGLCILGFAPDAGNEVGAYTRFCVKLNQSQFADTATGI